MYFAVQALTFGILVLAANTSYQGFPRLAAVLARDRFFPRQFVNLGDRLVYSNGIIVLAGIASLLIWVFHANVISLIHLYVIGVFTAFTLSQAGMVRYWLRRKERGWRKSAVINGFGAFATGVVTVLVIQAKFTAGAWMVVDRDPDPDRVLPRRQPPLPDRHPAPAGGHGGRQGVAASRRTAVVLYVDGLDPATKLAAWYAEQIAGTTTTRSGSRTAAPRPDPRGRWWDFTGGGTRIEPLEARRAARRRGARLRLGAPARRVELPHGRHPRGFERPRCSRPSSGGARPSRSSCASSPSRGS